MENEAAAERFPARTQFGVRLRYWRTHRGISQHDAGHELGYDRTVLSRVEAGRRWPSRSLARAAERLLDANGEIMSLWSLVERERDEHTSSRRRQRRATAPRRAAGPGQQASAGRAGTAYLDAAVANAAPGADSAARVVVTRSIGAGPSDVTRADHTTFAAPAFGEVPFVVTGEPSADPADLAAFIRACADADHVLGGKYVIEPMERQLAVLHAHLEGREVRRSIEVIAMAADLAEFAGWLWYDGGHLGVACARYLDALRWCRLIDDVEHETFVLCRLATLALRDGRLSDADAFIGAARAPRRPIKPLIAAWVARTEAIRHAEAGDVAAVDDALRVAWDAFDAARDDEEPRWFEGWRAAELRVDEAGCLRTMAVRTGQRELATRAVTLLSDAVGQFDLERRRDRALVRLRLASALELSGDLDAAAEYASDAARALTGSGSVRLLRELTELHGRLIGRSALSDHRSIIGAGRV